MVLSTWSIKTLPATQVEANGSNFRVGRDQPSREFKLLPYTLDTLPQERWRVEENEAKR